MGAANSKPTATAGPELTSSEKTAAEDTNLEEWLKQLEDRSNPVRLNVAHLLSLSVYASVDMGTNYDYLADHLLQTCSRSPHRRSKMLQTPFLNGETLITWTICHLPERLLLETPFDTIPPVLSVQLGCIPSWQANATLTDAMSVACCIRNANRLFQLLHPYRKSSNNSILYTLQRDVGGDKFRFTINDFPAHMLVKGRVDLRFICESRLYSIGFLIGRRGEWNFFYHLVHDRSGEKSYAKTIHVDLERFRGSVKTSVFKAQVSSRDWFGGEKIGGDASQLTNANEFVGSNRVLRGCIRVH